MRPIRVNNRDGRNLKVKRPIANLKAEEKVPTYMCNLLSWIFNKPRNTQKRFFRFLWYLRDIYK